MVCVECHDCAPKNPNGLLFGHLNSGQGNVTMVDAWDQLRKQMIISETNPTPDMVDVIGIGPRLMLLIKLQLLKKTEGKKLDSSKFRTALIAEGGAKNSAPTLVK